MKNQGECYEALLAGEKLDNGDFWCYLNKAKNLVDDEGHALSLDFNDYTSWQIYKEPKWYENIPDGGVLCWVKDEAAEKPVRREIDEYNSTGKTTYPFINSNTSACWKMATPLTKQEIQKFMDNAPEDL